PLPPTSYANPVGASSAEEVSFPAPNSQSLQSRREHDAEEGGIQFAEESQELVSSLQERGPSTTSLSDQPVDMPEWFVVEQCVAKSPGRWLLRGHDSVRRLPLAMKVTELPIQLTSSQSTTLLDVCEAASKVQNPRWIAPRVAAIQKRHLGVVRAWSFARPWNTFATDWKTQSRRLAEVAFAVESAHRVGATHGGLHAGNVLVDHDGKALVVDGASSQVGIVRWFESSSHAFSSLEERIRMDVQDLLKLVTVEALEWDAAHKQPLLQAIHDAASSGEGGACGAIGQQLVQFADGEQNESNRRRLKQRPRWRQRFARWIAGDAS
ncbi:MAG: hypothetical protein ACR2NZ_22110, partial [Rubripirellula sp.]